MATRKDLKEYVKADQDTLGMKYPLLAALTFGEHARVRKYLWVLRHAEYWKGRRGVLSKMVFGLFYLWYRRLCLKYGMYIALDSVGKGCRIEHPGFIRVDSFCRVGDYCTILPMVLLGKKRRNEDCQITIGHHCYIGTGATILGPVNIGNHVTVAAGAVVLHDVPDNAVVAGVPAKIVKINQGGVNSTPCHSQMCVMAA